MLLVEGFMGRFLPNRQRITALDQIVESRNNCHDLSDLAFKVQSIVSGLERGKTYDFNNCSVLCRVGNEGEASLNINVPSEGYQFDPCCIIISVKGNTVESISELSSKYPSNCGSRIDWTETVSSQQNPKLLYSGNPAKVDKTKVDSVSRIVELVIAQLDSTSHPS